MKITRCLLSALLASGLAACAPVPDLQPVAAYDTPTLSTTRYKAVLIAGDGGITAFDNATDAVATRLRDRGVAPADMQQLSAARSVIARDGVQSASRDHVMDAIAGMRPGPGQGCFVFATSHGAPNQGLSLTPMREVLSPASLDRALVRGCGPAPTVVVVSGCFSGTFARAPMARPNRVVLTAARADLPSFGCGAGRTYTVYDRCLLDALDAGGTWPQAYALVQQCVTAAERQGGFAASYPQAWFGPAVTDMPLPVGSGRAAGT